MNAQNVQNSQSESPKNPIDVIKKIEEEEKKPSAQEILEETEKLGKRDINKLLNQLKIILAISLGQQKNKDLAKVLDTDKSFASKQIKELEEQGLVKREGDGKEVTYKIDSFNVLKFLQSKVVIKWSKVKETYVQKEDKDGRTKETNN